MFGTPPNNDFGFQLHPEAQRFLKKEPLYVGKTLRASLPGVSDLAIDLLSGIYDLIIIASG